MPDVKWTETDPEGNLTEMRGQVLGFVVDAHGRPGAIVFHAASDTIKQVTIRVDPEIRDAEVILPEATRGLGH